MKKAIVPGSFDPITKGHIQIIEKASRLFDEVVVVLLNNSQKNCMFTIDERISLMCNCLKHLNNVICDQSNGLTVAYASSINAQYIVRGVRNIKDFEYEKEIALLNQKIDPSIETILLCSDEKTSLISSSNVKELFKYDVDIKDYVCEEVLQAMIMKRGNQ